MKFKAFYCILSLALCTTALAQIIGDESFKSFEHENKGCPINSLCSKNNGLLILEWERLLGFEPGKVKVKKLQEFYTKNGIPAYFLAKKNIQKKKDVVLNGSRCKAHNTKNPNNTLFKGLVFTKNIQENSQMLFDKIHLFKNDKKALTYHTSYGSRPLFIKDERLFFLEDFDDQFYQSSLSVNGDYKLVNLPQRLFNQAQSKRIKEVDCPKSKKTKADRYLSTYCQKIWDIDSNKMKTIQVFWSCP